MTNATATEPLVHGLVLAESLRPGTVLDGHDMRLTCVSRYEVTDPAEYQPAVWTAIEFELPERSAPALADQLKDSLLAPGWYANWAGDSESTIVFPGKVFRYRRGDGSARAAAQQYGRECGVPEAQLDWTD